MSAKKSSQGNKTSKAVSPKVQMTDVDLCREVSNLSVQEVDETTTESYCPFDLMDKGNIKEAIFGSFTPKELQELLEENEKELGTIEEKVIGEDNRTRIQAPYDKFPHTAICSLQITAQNGKMYIGTGFFVGPRVVLTAGHCVYMHEDGGWAKSIEVIPALDGSTRKFSSAISTQFHSLDGWTLNKLTGWDFGAIILPENAPLGQKTGWFGFGYRDNDAYFKNLDITTAGYPGDKGGRQQWGMSGKSIGVTNEGRKFAYQIDTYGGQSGSPVWEMKNSNYVAVGIHTNGSSTTNYATRILKYLFEYIKQYKEQYPAK